MTWYACNLILANQDRTLSGGIPNPLGHNAVVAALILDINGKYLASMHIGNSKPPAGREYDVTPAVLQMVDCVVYCITTKRWFVAWNRNEFRVQEGYQLYDVANYLTADAGAVKNDLESFLKSLGDEVGP